MTDLIVIAVIVLIVGGAIVYIMKEKKKGVKCIGCPAGATCPNSGKCTGDCSGHSGEECSCHTDINE